MSLTLNMVGGGSGGSLKNTNALVRVQAPVGSTVTMAKSGATTKTGVEFVTAADSSLSDYYFPVKPSEFDSTAWTITATKSGSSATSPVTIPSGSAGKEYSLVLNYLYTFGSYIESSGTQYIDTGIPLVNTSYTISGKFRLRANSTMNIFGVGNNNVGFGEVYYESNALKARYGGTSVGSVAITYSASTTYTFSLTTSTFTVSNVGTASVGGTGMYSGNMYLFARNMNGSAANFATARIYSFTIKDSNNTTLYNFKPAKRNSDDKVGFFETEHEQFYADANGGNFTLG